jgi:glycosyltransferase involved in cell wall biosynthesis
VGGLPEIIDHNMNGFIVPVGDHDAAASAIRLLLTDNEVWTSMSAASRRLYESRHSPHTWEKAMLRIHGSDA